MSDEHSDAEFRVTAADIVTDRFFGFRLADEEVVSTGRVSISSRDNGYECTFEVMPAEKVRVRWVNGKG